MTPDNQRRRAQLKLWWIIWAALIAGLCAIWWIIGFLKLQGNGPHANTLIDVVGMVPLFLSIVLRWLVIPRVTEMRQGFVLFVTGLALAEACGLLGIFLGGPYRDQLFLLGVLGIAQFMPFFARQYIEPRSEGFIPNN